MQTCAPSMENRQKMEGQDDGWRSGIISACAMHKAIIVSGSNMGPGKEAQQNTLSYEGSARIMRCEPQNTGDSRSDWNMMRMSLISIRSNVSIFTNIFDLPPQESGPLALSALILPDPACEHSAGPCKRELSRYSTSSVCPQRPCV